MEVLVKEMLIKNPFIQPFGLNALTRFPELESRVSRDSFSFFGDKEVQPQAANILSYKLLYFHWEVQVTRTCFF